MRRPAPRRAPHSPAPKRSGPLPRRRIPAAREHNRERRYPRPTTGLCVALLVRDRLADDGLEPLPKTSGRKGMQLVADLSGDETADEISAYVKDVADELSRRRPDLIVARMTKQLRPGKVFIDWSQNNAFKTTVAPYSLRAGALPTVSAPLTWEEVGEGTLTVADLTSSVVLSRVAGR